MTLAEKVALITALAEDSRFTDGQFRVAAVLILRFHNTATGDCFPSVSQLAKAAGVSETTVRRATGGLREIGLIHFEESNGGRSRRNTYTLKGSTSGPFRSGNPVASGPFTYAGT
jgi:DNA-binding MarR family transcriptional regulator